MRQYKITMAQAFRSQLPATLRDLGATIEVSEWSHGSTMWTVLATFANVDRVKNADDLQRKLWDAFPGTYVEVEMTYSGARTDEATLTVEAIELLADMIIEDEVDLTLLAVERIAQDLIQRGPNKFLSEALLRRVAYLTGPDQLAFTVMNIGDLL